MTLQLSELTSDQLLEWYTAEALRRRGYDVQPSTLEGIGKVKIESDDRARQIDVYAKRVNPLGLTDHLLVECKCHNERIGAYPAEVFSTAVNEIRGKLDGNVQGVFVSTSKLSESARTHLTSKSISIIDGPDIKEFLGNLQYTAVVRASEKEATSDQLLREYFAKIRFPASEFCKELKMNGVTESTIQDFELLYAPLLFWEFDIALEADLPGMDIPCSLKKKVMFLIRFSDNQPMICEEFEQIRAGDLVSSADNLVQERSIPSTLLPRPNMQDPFIEGLARTEALHRGKVTIHYSPILGEWVEGDPARLIERANAEIDEREQAEIDKRRREDHDRILDLDQKITELEADIESHTEELNAIDGLDETSRQVRHRAALQGKVTAARHRLAGHKKQKEEIEREIYRDVQQIRKKYEKQKSEAVKQRVVDPDRSQLSPDEYAVWIPTFKGTLSLDGKTQLSIHWNGVSGFADLGSCPHCGIIITQDNGALCNICLRVVCQEDSIICNKCRAVVCASDLWDCQVCAKQFCSREQKFDCSFCSIRLCQTCRIICTECGVIICKLHSSLCARCTRTLCQRHAINCAICKSFVCQAELISCEGCDRAVCRAHTAPCPNCSRIVCQDCTRKHLNIRRLLKAHGRENRCVLCISQS